MERQKQVKANAATKAETFLNQVYLKIGKGDIFSLDGLSREHKLSGSFPAVMKRLKIVEKQGNRKESTWLWIYPTKPDKALALTIMDEVNRYSGAFKGNLLKRALNQSESESNLFNSMPTQSERVYIGGCIAAGYYNEPGVHLTDAAIDFGNERIIFATEDLLNKLYNKSKTLKDERSSNQ